MPRENDLEGPQDMGRKHGGQAGRPKSPPRPKSDSTTGGPRDEDVVTKRHSDETAGTVAPTNKR
jgi:hypothetical protein